MATILVAASPEPRAVLESMLVGHDLFCAETIEYAEQLLRDRAFDLIVCTIAFDESRMFDFLQLAKAEPDWHQTPFVCVRARLDILRSPIAVRSAAITCRALGADAFLNIEDYHIEPKRELGDAIARFLPSAH
jgi:CheY-like chemotaxis protein